MPVRVLLNDGLELDVDLEWEEMLKLFRKALSSNQALRVENGNGKVRAINPHQILYFEIADPDEDKVEVVFEEDDVVLKDTPSVAVSHLRERVQQRVTDS